MTGNPSDWREFGVRIVRHGEFDSNTPQTPGMHREAAISRASAGLNQWERKALELSEERSKLPASW